jgi:hypothetical protein
LTITNKGIGGLLRCWGDGASLLRGQRRPRDTEANAGDEDEESTSHSRQSSLHSDTDNQGDDNLTEGEVKFGPDSEQEGTTKTMDEGDLDGGGNEDAEVDALARDVSALGLVPSSVRYLHGWSTLPKI